MQRPRIVAIGTWLCVLLLALSPAAQQPPAKSPSQQTTDVPVLRVTTRLVQVNVVLKDNRDRPVSDLKAEDFTLLENGKPQHVSVFSIESRNMTTRPAEPLPPNTFSNRAALREGEPNTISVILLDAVNTQLPDQAYARQQIARFLGQLREGDPVGIAVMTSRQVRFLHQFTGNIASLLRKLKEFSGELSLLEAGSRSETDMNSGIAELDEFLAEANRRVANYFLIQRARSTVAGLQAIANYLARFPGRKNLIWVSSAFPISFGYDLVPSRRNLSPERRSFYAEVEKAARAISNANVAVYPVDARGLLSDSRVMGQNIDTMNMLAERTGGRAFYNRNDLDTAVRKAIEDSDVTYVLGYYPTHGQWNGRFRSIRVKVNRPGISVRTRAGYLATAEKPVDEKERIALLRDAVSSPVPAGAIGITVQAARDAAARTLTLFITINPEGVTLQPENDRWRGAIDVLVSQHAADGHTLEWTVRTVGMRLKDETYLRLQKEGLRFSHSLEAKPGVTALRLAIRDATSGAVGTIHVALDSLR
jgi:VWFA-related protein